MAIRKKFSKFLHNVADYIDPVKQPEPKKLTPWEVFKAEQHERIMRHPGITWANPKNYPDIS